MPICIHFVIIIALRCLPNHTNFESHFPTPLSRPGRINAALQVDNAFTTDNNSQIIVFHIAASTNIEQLNNPAEINFSLHFFFFVDSTAAPYVTSVCMISSNTTLHTASRQLVVSVYSASVCLCAVYCDRSAAAAADDEGGCWKIFTKIFSTCVNYFSWHLRFDRICHGIASKRRFSRRSRSTPQLRDSP